MPASSSSRSINSLVCSADRFWSRFGSRYSRLKARCVSASLPASHFFWPCSSDRRTRCASPHRRRCGRFQAPPDGAGVGSRGGPSGGAGRAGVPLADAAPAAPSGGTGGQRVAPEPPEEAGGAAVGPFDGPDSEPGGGQDRSPLAGELHQRRGQRHGRARGGMASPDAAVGFAVPPVPSGNGDFRPVVSAFRWAEGAASKLLCPPESMLLRDRATYTP